MNKLFRKFDLGLSKYTYEIYALTFHRRFQFTNCVSTFFPPFNTASLLKETGSAAYPLISQRMQDVGLIATQSHGLYTLLPLGLRSVEKLIKIIDIYMKSLGAQKLNFPFLTSTSLWKLSGRLEICGPEIMQVEDRHKHKYILSPTYEEAVTDLVKSHNLHENKLPLRIYQISPKFRDEMRAKHGLLRAREFLMKDLYTFDKNEIESKVTYEEVTKVYDKLFTYFKLPVKRVEAGVGIIGGTFSHEYHVPYDNGEDILYECNDCNICINSELSTSENPCCPKCKKSVNIFQGIEVGHTFLLGTKYSSSMSSHYMNIENRDTLIEMGCYGLGVTRLLAIILDKFSTADDFIWPLAISPFKVCLIPSKKGSKEEVISYSWCKHFEHVISNIPGYADEIIVDDRTKLTIGRRIIDMKRLGIPIIIIIGKNSTASIPHFELIDTYSNSSTECTHSEILHYLNIFSW